MKADPKDGEEWEYWWIEWTDPDRSSHQGWLPLASPEITVMAMRVGRWSVIAEGNRHVLSYNQDMTRLLMVRRVS